MIPFVFGGRSVDTTELEKDTDNKAHNQSAKKLILFKKKKKRIFRRLFFWIDALKFRKVHVYFKFFLGKRLLCTSQPRTAMRRSLHSCLLAVLSHAMREPKAVKQHSISQLNVDMTRLWSDCLRTVVPHWLTQSTRATKQQFSSQPAKATRRRCFGYLLTIPTRSMWRWSPPTAICCAPQPLEVTPRLLLRCWLDVPLWRMKLISMPLFCAARGGYQETVELFPLTTEQVPLLFLFFPLFSAWRLQVQRRDLFDNTLLHLVTAQKPALVQRVWEMNPAALFIFNEQGRTPSVVHSSRSWSVEYFQWKLSMEQIEEAFCNVWRPDKRKLYEERFQEVVKGECGRSLFATRLCERRLRILVQGERSESQTGEANRELRHSWLVWPRGSNKYQRARWRKTEHFLLFLVTFLEPFW